MEEEEDSQTKLFRHCQQFGCLLNIMDRVGGKNKRFEITIHWTILEDLYKRLVKTDTLHSFFISLGKNKN